MQSLASNGRLRYITVGELSWYGHETMETALTEHALASVAVRCRATHPAPRRAARRHIACAR
eukprot:5804401-Prymnesium_polylepis.1